MENILKNEARRTLNATDVHWRVTSALAAVNPYWTSDSEE